MQLKTIEVHVNSDIELNYIAQANSQVANIIELDLEYDGSFQALEGFMSEKQSEINVNLDEAEFESEQSKNQSI